MSDRLQETGPRLIGLTASGLPLSAASREVGVPLSTVKHWLRVGRQGREPYATFAAAIDAGREASAPTAPPVSAGERTLLEMERLALSRAARPKFLGGVDRP